MTDQEYCELLDKWGMNNRDNILIVLANIRAKQARRKKTEKKGEGK